MMHGGPIFSTQSLTKYKQAIIENLMYVYLLCNYLSIYFLKRNYGFKIGNSRGAEKKVKTFKTYVEMNG